MSKMHPHKHSLSSERKWGGAAADYLAIHDWFDASKAHLADLRHRALRHHAEGIFACEEVFGSIITNSAGRTVPVRQIGEQHVLEDLGWIPTAADWLRHIRLQPWMLRRGMSSRDLSPPGPQDEVPCNPDSRDGLDVVRCDGEFCVPIDSFVTYLKRMAKEHGGTSATECYATLFRHLAALKGLAERNYGGPLS